MKPEKFQLRGRRNVGCVYFGRILFRGSLKGNLRASSGIAAGECALFSPAANQEKRVMRREVRQLGNSCTGIEDGAIWAYAIGTPLAIVAAVLAWKKVRVFMAQFSNAGQTLYIPYLKKVDYPVIKELNSELAKSR